MHLFGLFFAGVIMNHSGHFELILRDGKIFVTKIIMFSKKPNRHVTFLIYGVINITSSLFSSDCSMFLNKGPIKGILLNHGSPS